MDLPAITQRVSVLASGTEIMWTVDGKTIPSIMCNAVDKPVRFTPRSELVNFLFITHEPEKTNNSQAHDKGNSDQTNQSFESNQENFEFLDNIIFDYEN